jgi:hypothetical protein
MGMNTRALREDVYTNLVAEFTDADPELARVAKVFKCLPKKVDGASPCIMFETGPSRPSHTPEDMSLVGITFGLWILRDDADTAEDMLNDLEDDFIDFMNEHYNCSWVRDTEPGYEEVDGKVYRVSWHEIQCEWW